MVASRTACGFRLMSKRPLSTVVLLPFIPTNEDKLCTPDLRMTRAITVKKILDYRRNLRLT